MSLEEAAKALKIFVASKKMPPILEEASSHGDLSCSCQSTEVPSGDLHNAGTESGLGEDQEYVFQCVGACNYANETTDTSTGETTKELESEDTFENLFPFHQCAVSHVTGKRNSFADNSSLRRTSDFRPSFDDKYQPSLKHSNNFTPLDPQKYKTELCRSFQVHGSCRYGSRCNYAHGLQQLKVAFRHGKYKTRNCQSYHGTGVCKYGARCSFIHDPEEGVLKCSITDKEVIDALYYCPNNDRYRSIALVTWRFPGSTPGNSQEVCLSVEPAHTNSGFISTEKAYGLACPRPGACLAYINNNEHKRQPTHIHWPTEFMERLCTAGQYKCNFKAEHTDGYKECNARDCSADFIFYGDTDFSPWRYPQTDVLESWKKQMLSSCDNGFSRKMPEKCLPQLKEHHDIKTVCSTSVDCHICRATKTGMSACVEPVRNEKLLGCAHFRHQCSCPFSNDHSSDENASEDSLDSFLEGKNSCLSLHAEYKAEFCRAFHNAGFCKQDSCSCADSCSDIRKNPEHVYKSRKCFSFHKRGFCLYGNHCQFIHDS